MDGTALLYYDLTVYEDFQHDLSVYEDHCVLQTAQQY